MPHGFFLWSCFISIHKKYCKGRDIWGDQKPKTTPTVLKSFLDLAWEAGQTDAAREKLLTGAESQKDPSVPPAKKLMH